MPDKPRSQDRAMKPKLDRSTISYGETKRRVRRFSKNTTRHVRRFVSSRIGRLEAVRRMVFGWIALIIILTGVSLSQWAGFRGAYMTDAPAGGVFSEGVLGPLDTLNPLFARSSAEKSAARLLFSSLYSYDSTGSIKSDLAQSVAISEDEAEYTIKLRSGAVWSDGAPITAQDVIFTVGLLKNPDTKSDIAGWEAFQVEAVDNSTIKFVLPGPYSPFLHSLTFPILPKHILGDIKPAELREHDFSQTPVSSGPFVFRLMQSVSGSGGGKSLHMVANPRYIHGEPRLKRFQLNVYESRELIEKALKTSEIMATPELTYRGLPKAMQKTLSSQSYSINDGVFAIFNVRDGVLKSERIRQAMALSVDRGSLRAKIAQFTAPLEGPILDGQIALAMPGFLEQDIKKAQRLLDEEGWTVSGAVRKKEGQPLSISMVALQGSGFDQITDELAKTWREQLKIKVEVQIVDPQDSSQSVLQTVLQPRNFDVLVYELVLGGDPDAYAYWHSSQAKPTGLNFANYANAVVDDALSGGRTKRSEKYRVDRYKSFIRRWMADVPAIPLYQSGIDYITTTSVRASSADLRLVNATDRFADVIYWSILTKSVYKTP